MFFDRRSKFIEIADMPLEKRTIFVSSNTTLELYENVVVADTSGGAVTITLPDVGEAAGLTFDIEAPNGSSDAVTVNDANGSNVASSTISIDNGNVTVVSTGRNWRVVNENVS